MRAGVIPDPATGAIVTPIHQSTNFAFKGLGEPGEYEYSRCGNPTRKALEDNLAALEGGSYCCALSTGQAAELIVMNLFQRGDHIICGNDVYGGTFRLFSHLERRYGLEVSFISLVDKDRVVEEIRPNTRGIWIETPSNPLFNIVDLEALAAIAQEYNLISIADNTLLSPYCQRPLGYGIDIVVHSATKYLSGHNDGLGGAIICKHEEHAEEIAFSANALGTVMGAFDAWLILRGIKTLALRMREHQKNALVVVDFLQNHPLVKKIYYPGTHDHPQRAVIEKQVSGFGGLITFEIHGGIDEAREILNNARLFYIAESFGGVESLISHPQTMSHGSMAPEAQQAAGISESLIRLSVGLEDAQDIVADLEQALAI